MGFKESSKVKRILITTKRGLFGGTTSRAILKSGRSWDNLMFFDKYIDADSEQNIFEEFIESYRPEIIIHNAVKLPRGGDINDWRLKERNQKVYELVLNAAEKCKVQYVLTFTSYHVFHKALIAPFRLNDLNLEKQEEESWYSSYKVEEIRFASANNCKKSATRINFIMLPHMFGTYDNFGEGRRHFVADAIVKISEAKRHHEKKVVFKGDGRQKIQLASSESLVSFVLNEYLERISTADFIEVFDRGACVSLSEVANFISDTLNYRGRVVFDISANKRHVRNMYFREFNTIAERQSFQLALKEVIHQYTLAAGK